MTENDMILKSDIVAQKKIWVEANETGKRQLAKLEQEVATVRSQLVALEGAIQACNVFLSKQDIQAPIDINTE